MKGTEKQVKWAEEIKAGLMEQLEKAIENAKNSEKYNTDKSYTRKVDRSEAVIRFFSNEDAGWWISNWQQLQKEDNKVAFIANNFIADWIKEETGMNVRDTLRILAQNI